MSSLVSPRSAKYGLSGLLTRTVLPAISSSIALVAAMFVTVPRRSDQKPSARAKGDFSQPLATLGDWTVTFDHLDMLRATSADTFAVRDVIVDADGSSHVRMDRSIGGLKVLGGDVVVHQAKDGSWKGASLSLTRLVAVDRTPKLSAAQATAKVLAKGYKTESKPSLVIEARKGSPRLAYLVSTSGIQADGTPSEVTTTIDALTGAKLISEQHIETVIGDGKSLYSGTVPLDTTTATGGFTLTDRPMAAATRPTPRTRPTRSCARSSTSAALRAPSSPTPTTTGAPVRYRSREGRQDLVPRADHVHDDRHYVCPGPDRDAERGQGPVRRRQRGAECGSRRLVRSQRQLIAGLRRSCPTGADRTGE